MTDTMTSQNIDLSSWDTLYEYSQSLTIIVCNILLLSQVWNTIKIHLVGAAVIHAEWQT